MTGVAFCRYCKRATARQRPEGAGNDHEECLLRITVGGIGHLTDHDFWCLTVGDPDGGLSFRESALRVAQWVDVHGLPR